MMGSENGLSALMCRTGHFNGSAFIERIAQSPSFICERFQFAVVAFHLVGVAEVEASPIEEPIDPLSPESLRSLQFFGVIERLGIVFSASSFHGSRGGE